MSFEPKLAQRIRDYLSRLPKLDIEEKKMFGGLAFMVNGKMCVNASGQNIMCRFDPARTAELSQKSGFLPMIMRGKNYDGYCYVEPIGFENEKDFEFWIKECLDFNRKAKSSKK